MLRKTMVTMFRRLDVHGNRGRSHGSLVTFIYDSVCFFRYDHKRGPPFYLDIEHRRLKRFPLVELHLFRPEQNRHKWRSFRHCGLRYGLTLPLTDDLG